MKRVALITALLATLSSSVWSAPADMSGKLLVVDFTGAQQADAAMGEAPTKWVRCLARPLVLQVPTGCDNSYSYQLYESTPESPWPPVTVTYRPEDSKITIDDNDLSLVVTLSFTTDTEGTATVAWHEEIISIYMRGASFTISDSRSTAGLVTLPESEEQDGAVQCVDDGLGELVRELEKRQYKTAVERLYQKRLLILLPQIMEGGHIDNTIANANGTTALHNACGLSHTEIVQWLVDHGADLDAKTAKGAGVDDCVGGPNAKAIRAILRKARSNR